jgi:membrane protein DedA with SNARE-associated domain
LAKEKNCLTISNVDSLSEFVKNWGYWAVFFGAIIEGEAVILIASAFAAYDYLSIFYVFLISFLTTVLADQGLFWLGYKMGTDWVVGKFPGIAKARDKVFHLLSQLDAFFIFSFRFIYGIRIASPIIIGSAHVSPIRFAFYNTLSGFTWASLVCFIGYIVADTIVDGKIDRMPPELAIIGFVVLVVLGLLVWYKLRKANQTPPPNFPHNPAP